ncbi:MAG: DUF2442 domain-containing protein [Deltaproteobacteria bacterium]|nr:DUF2442 domain-containing protein [Deltaproteobacteria bacterium]
MTELPVATDVSCTDHSLDVALSDGRTLSVPLVWFPRLLLATPEERRGWRLVGEGRGIEWERLDEGITVEGLLLSS